ncbi:hypothetical protein Q3G72_028293 [Acer saccharum]|nr:hypothetical protein Q3G72_028293 [Acer saccharum]
MFASPSPSGNIPAPTPNLATSGAIPANPGSVSHHSDHSHHSTSGVIRNEPCHPIIAPSTVQPEVSTSNDLKGLDLQTCTFTFKQLKDATNNFNSANKLGEGGFGSVYKGQLSDGTIISVKQLSSKSRQGNRSETSTLKLDWETRQKICVGIAKGLAFLHEESTIKIVHRDIKATNVLLERQLNAKISDFGVAKLIEEDDTHISTRVAGTVGYMAPEYALWGHLTEKADVYSFGVVALEIAGGRNNANSRAKNECVSLLEVALDLQQNGNLMEIVLGFDLSLQEK